MLNNLFLNEKLNILREAFMDLDQSNFTPGDYKGPTTTIIKSKENFLFGGFVPTNWKSGFGFENCSNAFIFTLKKST